MDTNNTKENFKTKMITVAILLAIFFWVFDSAVDVFIFGSDEGFFEELIEPSVYEIYVRLLVFVLLLGCALYAAKLMERHAKLEKELKTLLDGADVKMGKDFFESLVRQLCELDDARWATVTEFIDEGSMAETIAVCDRGVIVDNISYPLKGAPCGDLLEMDKCFYPDNVQHHFPEDDLLREMGVESYKGLVLSGDEGEPLGLINIMDDKPMRLKESSESIVKVLAARATSELRRWRAEREKRELVKKLKDTMIG